MSVVSLSADREDRHNEQGLTSFGVSVDGSASDFYDLSSAKPGIHWNKGLGGRRLTRGLYEQLEKACKLCSRLDRYYLPLAIYLATRTGIGLREMCEVTWLDICIEKRRVQVPTFRADRQDGGRRSIVLPFMAAEYLKHVALALQSDNRFNQADRLFPMSASQLEMTWTFVADQTGIRDVRFDDLRREARIAFGEAGLTKLQCDIMMGSFDSRILPSPYSDLESIQDNLDSFVLGGLTYEEAKENLPLVPPEEVISFRKWAAAGGLIEVEEATPDVIPHFPNIVLSKL